MISQLPSLILPVMVLFILSYALLKKIRIYEEFVDGAKDGFKVSINIIPYLVAILVGISMFKASGAIDLLSNIFGNLFEKLSIPIDIFPIMITRSLSGSATLGLFSDIANSFGPDEYVTKLAAVMVGSSETTLYVLSVYFGAIGIKKYRYALLTGLLADFIGIVLAVWVARYFFLANI